MLIRRDSTKSFRIELVENTKNFLIATFNNYNYLKKLKIMENKHNINGVLNTCIL